MNSELPIDQRSPKDAWDEQHKLLASEPLTWTLSADELFRSFEVLAAQDAADEATRSVHCAKYLPHLRSVALMLAGFSIENMLKALYISKNSAFDSSGRFALATHNLRRLADDVGVSLTKDERVLLERLEHYLTWAGRYPVSLYLDDMRPRTLPSGGYAPITCTGCGRDFADVRMLATKLRSLLPTIKEGESAS